MELDTLILNVYGTDYQFEIVTGAVLRVGSDPDADICLQGEGVVYEHCTIETLDDGIFRVQSNEAALGFSINGVTSIDMTVKTPFTLGVAGRDLGVRLGSQTRKTIALPSMDALAQTGLELGVSSTAPNVMSGSTLPSVGHRFWSAKMGVLIGVVIVSFAIKIGFHFHKELEKTAQIVNQDMSKDDRTPNPVSAFLPAQIVVHKPNGNRMSRAYIQPETAQVGEAVRYFINVYNGTVQIVPQLRLPVQVGMSSGPSITQNIETTSHQNITGTQLSWVISGTETGEFVIPPQEVLLNRGLFRTNEVRFIVGINKAAENSVNSMGETPSKGDEAVLENKNTNIHELDTINSYKLNVQIVELVHMPLAELQAKSDKGYAAATLQLGIRYSYGVGVPLNDVNKGLQFIKNAAKAGSETAVGICARNGLGRGINLKLAFEMFTKSSDEGDYNAMKQLGRCYAEGIGCKKDQAKALSLFKKAATSRDPAAYWDLGLAYSQGIGTAINPAKAVEYWEKGSDSSLILNQLAKCYEKGFGCNWDWSRAAKALKSSADSGNAEAQRSIEERSLNIARSWPNQEQVHEVKIGAAERYLKTAQMGDVAAIGSLFELLNDGSGIGRSLPQAFEWLKKSSGDGNAWSMWYLGKCYLTGIGVERDPEKAVSLLTQASENNLSSAMCDLGTCYEKGVGCKANAKLARAFYENAAALGNERAQRLLYEIIKPLKAESEVR